MRCFCLFFYIHLQQPKVFSSFKEEFKKKIKNRFDFVVSGDCFFTRKSLMICHFSCVNPFLFPNQTRSALIFFRGNLFHLFVFFFVFTSELAPIIRTRHFSKQRIKKLKKKKKNDEFGRKKLYNENVDLFAFPSPKKKIYI